MSRRAWTLVVATVGAFICLVVAVVPSVPYVALLPGPTLNTLGSFGKKPLIAISGHRTYPASGHLNMVTVSYVGGPQTSFDLLNAMEYWLTPHDAVVPEGELFAPGQTQQQVVKQDIEQMKGSQQTAIAAALCQLKIKFATIEKVTSTVKGMPAASVLAVGDQITAVDGKPVNCHQSAGTLIKEHKPGTVVRLTVLRGGTVHQFAITTRSYQGQAVVGITTLESFSFPVSVHISIGQIGGPSAGLMFALGIIDKITPGNLTGGRFIAGTGEITANGTVQPIGGIQQKMVGARDAGATIFLTPAANCPDTAGAVPHGLRLIKVSTLAGAIAAIQDLAKGQPVPSC